MDKCSTMYKNIQNNFKLNSEFIKFYKPEYDEYFLNACFWLSLKGPSSWLSSFESTSFDIFEPKMKINFEL